MGQYLNSIKPNRVFQDFWFKSCSEAGGNPLNAAALRQYRWRAAWSLEAGPCRALLIHRTWCHRNLCWSPPRTQSYLTLNFSLLGGFPCANFWLCSRLTRKIRLPAVALNLCDYLLRTSSDFWWEKGYVCFNDFPINGVSPSLCSLIIYSTAQQNLLESWCYTICISILVERGREASPDQENYK